jgi:hemoglobin
MARAQPALEHDEEGHMTGRMVRAMALVGLMVGATACASMESAPAKPSLYKRLGGREGIALVVDDFWVNMAADARVNKRFTGLQPPAVFKLKSNISDQICDAAGGPCSYVGRDMKTTHKGMNISEAEWNATVENLVKALDKHKVPAAEKQELLALLGPMKGDIVGQ